MVGGVAEVLANCDRVLVSLPTSRTMSQLVEKHVDCFRPDQVIIDTTTGEPNEMVAIGARLAASGAAYVEACVAGSSDQMAAGEAILFLGGETRCIESLAELLTLLSRRRFHLGEVGSASRFKLVHNLVLGLHRAVLAEGLVFAEALGFSAEETLKVLQQTPARSSVMETKGPRMAQREYPPQARLSQHLKDVRLILAAAKGAGASTPLSETHGRLLEHAVRLGFGDADNSAIIEAFRNAKSGRGRMKLIGVVAGLHWIDGVVVVAYLLGVTYLGVKVGRRVAGLNEYFMPRKFGAGMMMMHAFGTGTASDQAVTVASATFRGGLSGIWYQWLWLFVTPFYWLIAPIFRRFRATTTADVYELRFDRSVAMLFAVVGMANMCVKIGLMLKGAGALIDAGTGGLIDADWAMAAMTVMFVIYGVAGGLSAAIVTDYVQGILTIVFSFMLLPCILGEVGGLSGVRQTITDPTMLSLIAPSKISLFFVVMMAIQALVGIVAQPFIMGVCAAGKTEWEGRLGIVGGNLIKRLCTVAWCLTAHRGGGLVHSARRSAFATGSANAQDDRRRGLWRSCARLPAASDAGLVGPLPGGVAGGRDEFLRLVHDQQRRAVHREHLSTVAKRPVQCALYLGGAMCVGGDCRRRYCVRLLDAQRREGA